MFTVFLNEAKTEPLLQVGSKAMYLAKIMDAGVTIPNGFVVLTPLFASYMAPAVSEGTLKAYETLKLVRR